MKNKLTSVLLVDGDIISNFKHENIIRQLGLTNEIKIAPNGEVAKTCIEEYLSEKNTFPELIFINIKMPIMDGYEFLSWYNNTYAGKNKTIIIAFASETHGELDKLYQLGITDHIHKPLTEESLISIVKKYFDM